MQNKIDKEILKTTDLCFKYKDKMILHNINICIKQNDIYGLVGKNGAGKTTLLRILSNLCKPTSGKYALFGIDNTNNEIFNVRKKCNGIIESVGLFLNYDALTNIRLQCQLLNVPFDEKAKYLIDFVGLSNAKTGKKAKDMSLGMRQRLGIAMCLVGSPELLILDEPINGLDPEGIVDIRNLLLKLNKQMHVTILISSHLLTELSKIATKYSFLHNGRLLKEITNEQLTNIITKKTTLTVNNINRIHQYLLDNKIEHAIEQNDKIVLKGFYSLNEINKIFDSYKNDIKLICSTGADLETFFMNLINNEIGATNA